MSKEDSLTNQNKTRLQVKPANPVLDSSGTYKAKWTQTFLDQLTSIIERLNCQGHFDNFHESESQSEFVEICPFVNYYYFF